MTWSHLSLNYSSECTAAVRSLNLPLSRPWGTILPCPLPLWHFLLWHFFRPWTFPDTPKSFLAGSLSLLSHRRLIYLWNSIYHPHAVTPDSAVSQHWTPISSAQSPSWLIPLIALLFKTVGQNGSFLFSFAVLHTAPSHLPQWCIAGSFSTSHPVPQPPIK